MQSGSMNINKHRKEVKNTSPSKSVKMLETTKVCFLGTIPLRVHYGEGNSSIHLWVQRQSRYLVVVGDISEKLPTAEKLSFGIIDTESSTFSNARFQRKL